MSDGVIIMTVMRGCQCSPVAEVLASLYLVFPVKTYIYAYPEMQACLAEEPGKLDRQVPHTPEPSCLPRVSSFLLTGHAFAGV